MPVINVRLQYGEQMGYNDTNANFNTGAVNYGFKTDRVTIMRYNYIPVPKGSTINSATINFVWSVKNDGVQSVSVQPFIDTNLGIANPWLDPTKNEWASASRSWNNYGTVASTFNWVVGGESRQLASLNVKAHLTAAVAAANWTLAGGSASFLISCTAVTNSDSQYFHSHSDGWSPVLIIDYTAPATDGKTTVVNLQENQNFDRAADSQGAFSMAPWGFNNWFGAYTQPAYSIINTMPSPLPAPPGNGKILQITPQSGRPMVHNGVPALDEGEWHNFSMYVFLPTSTPADMSVSLTVLGHKANSSYGGHATSVKGQWVQLSIDFIASSGTTGHWCSLQGFGTVWDATSRFYVASAQITKGRYPRPYIYGAKVLTNADHGWAGSNTGAFVRAPAPSVVPAVQVDKSRRKPWVAGWTYTSAEGHAQISSVVKTKKVRP